MSEYLKRTWAVVDLDCIAANLREIRRRIPASCKVMGVVKADAYGHGDRYVAEELARQGADWLSVSNLEEALSLRGQGISLPILVMGYTPAEQAATLAERAITQTVFSLEYARQLQQEAQRSGVAVDVHIKVDTGMSRLGFAAEAAGQISEACALPNLRGDGIFTHLACADESGPDSVAYTRGQFDRFMQLMAELEQAGLRFPLRHVCNSAGVIDYPEMALDMVRPGVILYGMDPMDRPGDMELAPVMSLRSCVSMVREIPQGTAVSYGREYIAGQDRIIAAIPIGYADGYSRRLSGRARVLVRGRYAPVVGRVCMDQMMADVTDIPGVAAGDIVTLVGRDGEHTLTFDEMARLSGTIHYEKVCLIGKRVPRVYLRGGKEIGVVGLLRP